MNQLRWGVLGTARIGTQKVIPALQRSRLGRVVAIASRDQQRAEAAARDLDIPQAHASYEMLLEDPQVDAVYIPLPNHLHVPWTLKALQAGKHVLCEKPLGVGPEQVQQVIDAAARSPQLKVMEGFMYRHHPQWTAARELIGSGTLGRLKTIQVLFAYFNDRPDDIRNSVEAAGGALMDIGCYPVSLAHWIFGGQPTRVLADLQIDPNFGTDWQVDAQLHFPEGTATFTCSTQMVRSQRATLVGDRGRLEFEKPFNPQPDVAARFLVHTGDEFRWEVCQPCDQFTLQGDLFARSVLDDTPVPTPLTDALENMQTIQALQQSHARQSWVALESG